MLKEGGTSRRKVFQNITKQQPGGLEYVLSAFGGSDSDLSFGLLDTAMATAAVLSISTGPWGALNVSTVHLICPEQINEARGKAVSYRAQGVWAQEAKAAGRLKLPEDNLAFNCGL